METKQTARELLKEARSYVNSMEVEYQHRNEGGYYEEELRRAVDFKDRIDAYLAATNESAMDIVRVPMKMLIEIFNHAVDWVPIGDSERVDEIAAKYGAIVVDTTNPPLS